ncbi:MAG: STAS domain-containing protein [Pseudohongiellaceae bacterium]
MQIDSQLSPDQHTLTLVLAGKFDYTCHQVFQEAYEASPPQAKKYVIDLAAVPSIDSSALGMLLLLRTHAGGDDADVTIVNTSNDIYKLLQSCKFDELFKVSAAF